jgi:hypothetical protein
MAPSRSSTVRIMIAPSPSFSLRRPGLLAIVAGVLALALLAHGAIPQWADYHAFAGTRRWFGVPNAENVLSNVPFALIGLWGCFGARGSLPWRAFGAAVFCTAFGSALYHWAPGNAALVADRLPIAWACAALSCGLLSERVDARWGSATALSAALLAASCSVAWWWLGEQHGAGDLRPYLFVQFLPMVLVPTALLIPLPALRADTIADSTWWTVLGLYAVAKLMEVADHTVLDALGVVSGHTLKHLLAAAAALCLVRAVNASTAQLR